MSTKTNPIMTAPSAPRKVGAIYCRGFLSGTTCPKRKGCAHHAAFQNMPDDIGRHDQVLTLPYVPGKECHYFKPVE